MEGVVGCDTGCILRREEGVGVERDAVGGDAVGTPRLGQRLGQQTNPFTQRRQRRVLGAAGRRHQGHEHDERAAVRRQGFMRLAGKVDHRSQRAITRLVPLGQAQVGQATRRARRHRVVRPNNEIE